MRYRSGTRSPPRRSTAGPGDRDARGERPTRRSTWPPCTSRSTTRSWPSPDAPALRHHADGARRRGVAEAAVAAAAYGVRSACSRAARRSTKRRTTHLATLPDGTAKTQGLAVGAEVAAGILALRANDGRSVALAPYVPGSRAGQFRGANPVGRPNPFIKPFWLTPRPVPRARTAGAHSAAYAADVNETKALGSATSTTAPPNRPRSPASTPSRRHTLAREHAHLRDDDRSLRRSGAPDGDVWVAQADAGNACFESKYIYLAWRPSSADRARQRQQRRHLADAAGPVVATPNHPIPGRAQLHRRRDGRSRAQLLRHAAVTFDINSLVTSTPITSRRRSAWVDEVQVARIAGGIHFRFVNGRRHGARQERRGLGGGEPLQGALRSGWRGEPVQGPRCTAPACRNAPHCRHD